MSKKTKPADNDNNLPGNPRYGAKDDIYAHEQKEEFTEGEEAMEENLDVPGAELDDEDELIGEEDEENNYYSLGGDNHDDLEEGDGD